MSIVAIMTVINIHPFIQTVFDFMLIKIFNCFNEFFTGWNLIDTTNKVESHK